MKAASYGIAISAALLLLSSIASIQAKGGGGAPRQACAMDLTALCAGIAPGDLRIRSCIMSHMGDLSAACATKLSRASFVAKECEADVREFCGGVKSGHGSIATCMKPHLREVSEPCKSALAYIAIPGRRP